MVQEFLDTLGNGDIPEWIGLLDTDVVAETPFAPEGTPRVFRGLDEVTHRFGDARRRMQSLEFLDREVWATAGGPVVATCRSVGVRGDGAPYRNSYCWLFWFESGRIRRWVEYFDPQEVLRSRGA